MDEGAKRPAARRLPQGLEGIGRLHELLAGVADAPGEVVVGIEVDRGLWAQALVAAGSQVYAINPLAVAPYRGRHNVAGAKPDADDSPDADISLSLPGLGDVLGARVLGEFGDDPQRWADTKSPKNDAGTSPPTVASGKKRAVLARHVRNRRLDDAIDQRAFCSLSASPDCRQLYDQRRAAGDLHH